MIVQIYDSLQNYAKNLPIVEVRGVTRVAKSVVGGWVFFTGADQHIFPASIIFVTSEE